MLPWEHALVALVPLVAYSLARHRRPPLPQSILVVLFASQLPDLVDKPLAHGLGVIPNGRAFMHSLVVALPFVLLVLLIAWYYDRTYLGGVYAWGHLSHIAADVYPRPSEPPGEMPGWLLWPLTEAEPSEGAPPAYEDPTLLLEMALSSYIGAVATLTAGIVAVYACVSLWRGSGRKV